jgi:hypothetical protein
MTFSNSNQQEQYKEDDQGITLPRGGEGRNTAVEESFVAVSASTHFVGPESTSSRLQDLESLAGQILSRDYGPPHSPRSPEDHREFLLSVLREALQLCRDDDTFRSGPQRHPQACIAQSKATDEAKQQNQQ